MILNLTQHNATKDQIDAGINDLPELYQDFLKKKLTFPVQYDKEMLVSRANTIAKIVEDFIEDTIFNTGVAPEVEGVMIGGMPSFMPVLESVLVSKGLKVGYACTDRVSKDVIKDGEVIKTSVFVHAGMYWAN